MGAVCSCFTGHHEETAHHSRQRISTHQNLCSVLSYFTKIVWPMRVLPSHNPQSSTSNGEADTVSLRYGAAESIYFSGPATTKQEKSEVAIVHVSDSSNEDVCPTCFEGYTVENPKIAAECSHHFHLSCIYEWRERSETCPYCRQVMIFGEML